MPELNRRSLIKTLATAGVSASAASHLAFAAPREDLSQSADSKALVDYLAAVAPRLLRTEPHGFLKYPSVAPTLPSSAYSSDLWDWDTPWVSRGLFSLAKATRNESLHAQVTECAKGSLRNFFTYQSAEGRLPILIQPENKDVFGCLKETAPAHQNQAKPVMSSFALLISDETGSVDWLAPLFGQLLRHHDAWLGRNQAAGLLVWGDDVAIGNDNDPTTFGRPFFSSANLLLNCLFYRDLLSAQTLAERLGRPQAERQQIAGRIEKLAAALQKQCWDKRDSFFYTVDVQCVDRRAELIPNVSRGMDMSWSTLPLRIQTFTGFLPLWCGLATREQASELVRRNYLSGDRFRAAYGVRSLSNLESMYSLAFSGNPSNWLGPIWIISNYFVWRGLQNYGFDEAADDLARKTIRVLASGLAVEGSLNEYYHPDTGAPLSHKGFLDWNLLVLEMMQPAK